MCAVGEDMEWTENPLSHAILGCAIEVHKALGPGLLESAYQRCLEIALKDQNLRFERERPISLNFRGTKIAEAYRLDFVVETKVIVEVKSVKTWGPVFDSQLLTYLKLTGCRLGLLINFNVSRLPQGIRRIVQNLPDEY